MRLGSYKSTPEWYFSQHTVTLAGNVSILTTHFTTTAAFFNSD